ncbi:GNAT family N-acetyltransferase [Clostridium uliginosum]|uniref:Protein N-acetyltransferase, RimJ/RimL family n=1 Tax=Clostridium uliginosum TaxID=119641 RepID=A0A1I1LJ30_9CLOT|nr:GNAT family protein [Clostridium uliginosum]SFC69500.1 Protein N-acetyltransferase, RimJ/RimL family [Clostridium uliginosum]
MLKGNRIYLRLIEIKDIRRLYDLCNDEEVKKYNNQLTHSEKNKALLKNINNIGLGLKKALSIINEKNVLVGFITYKQIMHSKDIYSIGITIGKMYWNRGYGEDSINTLIKYLFNDLNALRIELEVVCSNLRAIRCYKKCGFVEEGRKRNGYYIDGEEMDIIIMGILKKEMVL